jgi:hypothetical protein
MEYATVCPHITINWLGIWSLWWEEAGRKFHSSYLKNIFTQQNIQAHTNVYYKKKAVRVTGPIGLLDVKNPTLSRQSADGKVVSPMPYWSHFTPQKHNILFLVL